MKLNHGNANTYSNYGCKCDPCRKANAEKLRAWRKRKREELAAGLIK